MPSLTMILVTAFAAIIAVNADCDVGNGKVFPSGETFTFDQHRCVSYICEGNMYKVKEAKCFDVDSNKCVKPGTLVKRKGCEVYECVERDTKFGAVIHFKHKEVQCPVNGKCHPDGDTVTYNGKQCKCKADDISYTIVCPTEAEQAKVNEAKEKAAEKAAGKKKD